MKIGAFSKKYSVSIDTIRHYMNIGLLYPPKKNGQYEFDSFMCQQMEEIISMKDYGLTLAEIGYYMYYNRLNSLDSRDISTDINFFEGKLNQINHQIEALKIYEGNIIKQIDTLRSNVRNIHHPIGVSILDLPLLACPDCKGELSLNTKEIIDNQVFEGSLECKCGKVLAIKKGVIINGDYPDESMIPSTFDIVDYINETPMDYYNMLTLGLEWSRGRYLEAITSNMTTLEVGTGHGIFLRACHKQLAKNGTYICSEIDPGRLFYLKEIIEYFQPQGRKLFILGDFRSLPIKEKSIDCLLDIASTNLDLSDKIGHPFEDILPLWTSTGKIIATTFISKHIGQNTQLSKENITYFNKKAFLDLCEAKEISIDHIHYSDILPIGGKYEKVSMDGDEIYICYLSGHHK